MRIDYREKTKKVIFSVLMVAFTLMVCFLVLQYGFANFYYSDVDKKRDKMFDPVLGWVYQPGTYLVKPPHSFSKHVIYINKHGLRNRDIASDHEAGIRRILILGDSFTFGKSVPTAIAYDFTTSLSKAFGTSPMIAVGSSFAMYGGDGNASGGVTASDKAIVWRTENGTNGYLGGDYNLSGGVTASDANNIWRLRNGRNSEVP